MGIAKIAVLGMFPLISLIYLNWKIYNGVKFPLVLSTNFQRQQRREHELAKVLIGILIVFIVCHTFRVAIEIDNMVVSKMIEECYKAGKPQFSLWSLVIDPLSELMMVLNSSINTVIYCCLNANFRKYIFPCIKQSRHSLAGLHPIIRNRSNVDTTFTEILMSNMETRV